MNVFDILLAPYRTKHSNVVNAILDLALIQIYAAPYKTTIAY